MIEMSEGLPGPAPEDRPEPEGRRNAQGVRVDPDAAAEPEPRRAVLSATVDHEPGVLASVATLFSRRRFNIESLAVGPTAVDGQARITLVVEEPEPGVEQAKRQLRKLRPVRAVAEVGDDAVERELALVKVDADDADQLRAVTEACDGATVDAGPETITVELTGTETEVDRAIEALSRFGVREVVRTGTAALARGPHPTEEER